MDSQDQKVFLITGATGFIGSHLARSLSEEGKSVRCLVRRSSSQAVADFLKGMKAEIVYGDLLDKQSLKGALEGVGTVFHLGGGGRIGMPRDLAYRINVEGTRNILEACLQQGEIEKVVHTSTCAVMGDIKGSKPADEAYPYNPSNLVYSKVKTEAERLVLSYKNRLPIVVVRFPGVYGPPLIKGDSEGIDGVTPFLTIISSIKTGQWRYIGDGKNLAHLVYVDDAVRGMELAASKGRVGETYIIGNGRSIPMDELVGTIAGVLGVEAPTGHMPVSLARFFAALFELRAGLFGGRPRMTREMVTGFTGNLNIDTSKAKRELGYVAKVNMASGMENTTEWYEKNRGRSNRPEPQSRQRSPSTEKAPV